MFDPSAFDLTDPRFRARLAGLAIEAKQRLSAVELARCEQWCAQHNDPRWYVVVDGEDLVIMWGGSRLQTLDEELLRHLRDDDDVVVTMTELPDVPDFPPDDTV